MNNFLIVALIILSICFLLSCAKVDKEEEAKKIALSLFEKIVERDVESTFDNSDSLAKIYFDKKILTSLFEIEKDLYGNLKSFDVLQNLDSTQTPCIKKNCQSICSPANVTGMYTPLNYHGFNTIFKANYQNATVYYPIVVISRNNEPFKLACFESFSEKSQYPSKAFDLGRKTLENIKNKNYDELWLTSSSNLQSSMRKYQFEDIMNKAFTNIVNPTSQFKPMWHHVSIGHIITQEEFRRTAVLQLTYMLNDKSYIYFLYEKEGSKYLLNGFRLIP